MIIPYMWAVASENACAPEDVAAVNAKAEEMIMDARDPWEPLYQKRRYYKLRKARIPAKLWPLFPYVGRPRPALRERLRRLLTLKFRG